MPWSKTNTIDSLKNKSDKIKEVFAEAANSALKRGLSEEDAIFAGLGAVSRYEKVLDSVKKSAKPEIPLHLKAVLQSQEGKIQKAYLPENSITSDSSRSLVSVDWDKQGRLVLTFDDGEKIVTSQAPIAENITQNFAAAARIRTASGGTDVITGLTVGLSASDIILDSVGITAGQTVTINSASITHA